jgi:hypothetical protein
MGTSLAGNARSLSCNTILTSRQRNFNQLVIRHTPLIHSINLGTLFLTTPLHKNNARRLEGSSYSGIGCLGTLSQPKNDRELPSRRSQQGPQLLPGTQGTALLIAAQILLDTLTQPGGVRAEPPKEDLQQFVESASSMDGLKMAELMMAKMVGRQNGVLGGSSGL